MPECVCDTTADGNRMLQPVRRQSFRRVGLAGVTESHAQTSCMRPRGSFSSNTEYFGQMQR